MSQPVSVRNPSSRAALKAAFTTMGIEVIPFKGTADAVLAHVPTDVSVTVTVSPVKGQDATVEMATTLARHGYTVAPHISAQQVRDRAHLADLIAQCRAAGVTDLFVVGGDPSDTPTAFRDARDLLEAVHECDHGFTDIGIAGHPEGHPAVGTGAALPGTQGQGGHGHPHQDPDRLRPEGDPGVVT